MEAFVGSTIAKGHVRLNEDEREELTQEGLRIMCKLSQDYEPGRNGLDPSSSKFSGYAAKFLPGKLSDAWHRLQGHRLATLPDGSRQWQYDQQPASLNHIEESRPGALDSIQSLQHNDGWEPEILEGLPQILADWWERRCDLVTRYFEMKTDGYSTSEFAMDTRLLPAQARVIEGFAKELYRDLRREQMSVAA